MIIDSWLLNFVHFLCPNPFHFVSEYQQLFSDFKMRVPETTTFILNIGDPWIGLLYYACLAAGVGCCFFIRSVATPICVSAAFFLLGFAYAGVLYLLLTSPFQTVLAG